MDSDHQWPGRYLLLLSTGLVLVALSACTSKSATKTELSGTRATAENTTSHVDLMCIGDRINNPPESFHFSYKYTDASISQDKQADITPQSMDITIKDQTGIHSYHGVRSDELSWNRAVLDLSGLGMSAMISRLDSLNDTSAIKPQATETMNGYDTTHYALDTTNVNSSDQKKFEFLFGKGSFEKGMVWTSSDGCAVKLVLDERVLLNGNLKDAHYEMARVRK
jgi:hypothetical protein